MSLYLQGWQISVLMFCCVGLNKPNTQIHEFDTAEERYQKHREVKRFRQIIQQFI